MTAARIARRRDGSGPASSGLTDASGEIIQLAGTDRVKVTLATNVIPGWNEIDAVQLVGKDQ
ncbi:MAG: hypothetical protein ACXVH0_00665 [Thermoanaerobaculia bacterium]